MPVHRLIIRLDFKTNFEIIDRPGTVMRALDNVAEGFWRDLRESQRNRQIMGTYKSVDKGQSRVLTVEPGSIHGAMESLKGWSLDQLAEKDETFRTLLKVVDQVSEKFSVRELNRAGLRVFYFSRPAEKLDQVHSGFRTSFSGDVLSAVEEHLGGITDYMFSFDGVHEDKIEYHFRSGPYAAREAKKYLREFHEELHNCDEYNFVCDLDLYEKNFSAPYGNIGRWCRPLFVRARKMLEEIEHLIQKREGG